MPFAVVVVGVHSYDVSDLPVWDWRFGTLRNLRQWEARCGFTPERDRRFGDGLRGRDVSS